MKKKFVSLLLAAALCCTLWVPALAVDTQVVSPSGLWFDQDGSLLFTDLYGKALWRQSSSGAAVLVAGGSGSKAVNGASLGGFRDGKAAEALFQSPWSVVPYRDGWAISDTDNHAVRLMHTGGAVQTLAGSGTAGMVNGTASNALLSRPTGLAPAPDGGLFVADTDNNVIRLIDKNGQVTTYAGGAAGCADGSLTTAQFLEPTGLWAEGSVLYVADSGNNRICKIENKTVSTLAGGPDENYVDGGISMARFAYPQGVLVSQGVVYVADTGNGAVRAIQGGRVSTLLAPGSLNEGRAPVSPRALAVGNGQLYVGDVFAQTILTVSLTPPAVPSYTDVPADAGYASAIGEVTGRGLMYGVEPRRFGPDLPLDRGGMVQILSTLHGSTYRNTIITGSATFPDLAPGDPLTTSAAWAGDSGIVQGVSGKLRPKQDITWSEALVMLHRYTTFAGGDAGVQTFSPLLSAPDWAADACGWAAANGLIQSVTFQPSAAITRAEAAVLLSRFLRLTGF